MAETSPVLWPQRQGPPCWVGMEMPSGAAQRMLTAVRRLVGALGPAAARWCWVRPEDWWIPLWVMVPGTPPGPAADAVRRVAQEMSALSLSLGPWDRWQDGGRLLLVAPAGTAEAIRSFQETLKAGLDRQGFEGEAVGRPGIVVAWSTEGAEAPWEAPAEGGESGPPGAFTGRTIGILSGDLPPASFSVVRTVDLRRDGSPRRPREDRDPRTPNESPQNQETSGPNPGQ